MFFNYDSFEIVAIAFVVAGVFTYFYSTSSPIINNESNYINSNYLIDGINHTVLVLGNNILTVDPNIVLNPFIC